MIGSSGFMYGDSNNSSEDLSGSLSSTAVSVSKLEFNKSIEAEFTQENDQLCNPKEKPVCCDTLQMGEHRKGGVARSKKKHRGATVEPEKDNSYTNLRSSSVAYMGVRSSPEMSSSRRLNEVHYGRPLPCEEAQIGYFSESGGESIRDGSQYDLAANLSWKPKEKGEHKASESHLQQPTSCDPLVGSIILLQAVQEALEKEVEHFREIGKNQISSSDGSRREVSSNTKICSTDQVIYVGQYADQKLFSGIEDMGTSSKVYAFQRKLEETLAMLDTAESKVAELERILSKNDLVKEESARSRTSISGSSSRSNSLNYLKEKSTEMENEVQALLKKKVKAKKEYYQQLDEIRKKMGCKKQLQSELVASEKGVLILKAGREEELMLEEKEKLLKMKDNIYKYGFCLVVQLIFLLFVFAFWMQLPQQSVRHAYVPT